jgi:hypothetical protein
MTNTLSTRNTRFGRTELFGCSSRFAVRAQTTTLLGEEVTMWMVTDAEKTDELTGSPAVIRQTYSKSEAVAGLNGCTCGFCD